MPIYYSLEQEDIMPPARRRIIRRIPKSIYMVIKYHYINKFVKREI